MLFNSYTFCLLFLPLCLLGFAICLRWLGDRAICGWLVACSLGFYAWWNPAHLPLLLASMGVNYLTAWAMVRWRRRSRLLLTSGIVLNLASIAYYKYAGFLTAAAGAATGQDWTLAHIALPLAISFFTFQQIAFLVDVYRTTDQLSSPLHYLLFVTFFPQLIAGPIVAHRELVPQFQQGWSNGYPWEQAARGITLFAFGLFKKVIFADALAIYARDVFQQTAVGASVTMADAFGGTLAYGLQLYFDFSGYSDMAIGLGLLFGIALPCNFDSPYKSLSIDEFWRRWHITLGAFFREYLYFPLGGSRCGAARTCLNLFITMVLCGLWHGAGWSFLVWGALHGGAMIVSRTWHSRGWRLPGSAAWCLTFAFVMLAWVPFRTESLAATRLIYSAMLGLTDCRTTQIDSGEWIKILLLLGVVLVSRNSIRWVSGRVAFLPWRPKLAYAYLTAAFLFVTLLHLNQMSTFLYFNF